MLEERDIVNYNDKLYLVLDILDYEVSTYAYMIEVDKKGNIIGNKLILEVDGDQFLELLTDETEEVERLFEIRILEKTSTYLDVTGV